MKLKECMEIGRACGLYSIEECYKNIILHSLSLFKYDDISKEIKELQMDLSYALACLYMGMTEEYDRSLTDKRSKYDPTEAFLCCNKTRSESNRYAAFVRNKIMKDYCIGWKEIQSEICRHNNYSAQHWINEYERIWK